MKYLENEKDFQNEIKEGTVIVDFYADWCGPCRMLSPVLEELEKERKDIKIIKVNTDNFLELSKEFGIMSIPALKIFKDGKLINSSIGYIEKEAIEDLLK